MLMASALGVLGFAEAAQAAMQVRLPEQVEVKVTALPMLAVLKLLAWEDRHQRKPRTDAPDLFLILRNYEEAGNADRLYEEFSIFLDDDQYDEDQFSAWLIGHDARKILARVAPGSERVREIVVAILERETGLDGALELVAEGRGISEHSRLLGLLRNFSRGLQGIDSLAG